MASRDIEDGLSVVFDAVKSNFHSQVLIMGALIAPGKVLVVGCNPQQNRQEMDKVYSNYQVSQINFFDISTFII